MLVVDCFLSDMVSKKKFLASGVVQPSQILRNVNLLFLTKETTKKNRSFKTQLFLSKNSEDDKVPGECIQKDNKFFGDYIT